VSWFDDKELLSKADVIG